MGRYTASVVSLKDALIGWRAFDCDTPIQLLRIQTNTGNTVLSPTWHKQTFLFWGLLHGGYFAKAGNFLPFSEAADSPMLADMGRETVYCQPVTSSSIVNRSKFGVMIEISRWLRASYRVSLGLKPKKMTSLIKTLFSPHHAPFSNTKTSLFARKYTYKEGLTSKKRFVAAADFSSESLLYGDGVEHVGAHCGDKDKDKDKDRLESHRLWS